MRTLLKYLISILLIVRIISVKAQEYDFSWLHPSPQGNAIWSIAFADETVGYAVGGKGIILKTNDMGDTWSIIRNSYASFDKLDLFDVVVSSSGSIFSAGANGKILKSSDEGNSWQELQHPQIDIVYDLCINPNGNISCCGTNGKVFMSEDEGGSWIEIGIQSENTVKRMYWKSESEGYLVVANEGFYRTTDMGQSWVLAINSPFAQNNDIFFVNENRGLALRDYAVFTTDDGGDNWEDATSQMNIADELYATVVLSEEHFISTSIGEGGEIQETFDGGFNWQMMFEHAQVLGFTNIVEGPDDRIFFGSTASGIFYRNQNMEFVSCTINLSEEEGDEVNLFQAPDSSLFAYLEPYPTNASSFNMVIRSDDFGGNWYLVNLPFEKIDDLKFDGQTILTIGEGTWLSTDGGITWQQPSMPINSSPKMISMPSSAKYFLLCKNFSSDGGTVLSSTNGGVDWQLSGDGLPVSDFEGIAISFPTPQTRYVLGKDLGSIKLYKTINSGLDWELVSAPPISNAKSMSWLNTQTGFVCSSFSYAPGLFKTSNGGQSWALVSSDRFFEVRAATDDRVVAFNRYGSSNAFFQSLDGGETFNWTPTPFDDGTLNASADIENGICSVVATQDGWFFGRHGSKIIAASSTITGIENKNSVTKRNNVEIISLSPNPTTCMSTIEFKLESNSSVNMITYNAMGVVVKKSKTKLLSIGKQKMLWDGSGLPGGCYFILIKTNSGAVLSKIIKQ